MVTVCDEIVLDSKLSEKSERVYWHLFLACKLYQAGSKTDIDLYRIIF